MYFIVPVKMEIDFNSRMVDIDTLLVKSLQPL